jgi:hypothetical protein
VQKSHIDPWPRQMSQGCRYAHDTKKIKKSPARIPAIAAKRGETKKVPSSVRRIEQCPYHEHGYCNATDSLYL